MTQTTNLSKKMTRIRISGTLKYNRILQPKPKKKDLLFKREKEIVISFYCTIDHLNSMAYYCFLLDRKFLRVTFLE